MKRLWDLFISFAKIGAFTFGGGYAMISIIEDTCVERKKLITQDEIMNMTVLAESTPGPIAINCSTYVGYKEAGMAGAVAATVGMVMPSFVIIFIISQFLDNFLSIAWVKSAFTGIKIAVSILIIDAGGNMFKKMEKKKLTTVCMAVALAVMLAADLLSVHISSVVLLIIFALFSMALFAVKQAKDKGGDK